MKITKTIWIMIISFILLSGIVSAEQGLIASYDFENNLNDDSGNWNSLRSFGDVVYVNGNMGEGIYLNGNGRSYLQLDSSRISASKGSIEIWASYEGPLERIDGSAYLLSHYGDGGPNRFYLTKYGWNKDYNLAVGMGSECYYPSSYFIGNTGMHQYVITWENQKFSTYVDGIKYIDNVGFIGINSLLPYITIGAWMDGAHTGEDWKGVVDTIRVYDYKISDGKIMEHFNAYKSPVIEEPPGGTEPTNSTRKFMVMVIVETDDENFSWEGFTEMMDEHPEGVYFSEIKEGGGLSLKQLFERIIDFLF